MKNVFTAGRKLRSRASTSTDSWAKVAQEGANATSYSRLSEPPHEGVRLSLESRIVLFFLQDVFLIGALGFGSEALSWRSGILSGWSGDNISVIVLSLLIYILLARSLDVYKRDRILRLRYSVPPLATAVGGVFAALLLIAAASKTSQNYSRIWFFSWALSTCAIVPIARICAVAFLRKQLRSGSYIFRAMSAGIFRDPLSGQDIARRSGGQSRTDYVLRLDSFDELEQLADTIARGEIDQIYIVVPWVDAPALLQRMQMLRRFASEIFVLPDDNRIHSLNLGVSTIGDRLSLKALERPIDGWNIWRKRTQDVLVSGALLAFFAPIMLVIALAIAVESRGPILFRQRREGFNGRHFNLYKFRSMYENFSDAGAAKQTGKGDPRVTHVGQFIRATSLDELPQFINVLRGTMSVVGPRPHALQTRAEGRPLDDVVDQYAMRHRVKPGITGWAQVQGLRGEIDTVEKIQKRVQLDIEYIDNWSTWLDVKIIFRTMLIVFYDPTAY